MIDHLEEIEELAATCIGQAIELLPGFEDARTEEETRERTATLLINLRAIQHEAEMLRSEGRAP